VADDGRRGVDGKGGVHGQAEGEERVAAAGAEHAQRRHRGAPLPDLLVAHLVVQRHGHHRVLHAQPRRHDDLRHEEHNDGRRHPSGVEHGDARDDEQRSRLEERLARAGAVAPRADDGRDDLR
jgi:hypothetical protein